MTNLGFVHAMREAGIEVFQTKVGDRYVLEAMREGGYVLGGEQSGRIDFARAQFHGRRPYDGMSVPGGGSSKRKAGRGGHQGYDPLPKR